MTSASASRRPRGTARDYVTVFAKVEPNVKAKVERVAEALGISQAQAVQLMLASVSVDAHGRPSFWEGELPSDAQKELPLTG